MQIILLNTTVYSLAFKEEHINQNYYNDMFVIMCLICIGLFRKPASERALDVMRLLREFAEPQLWREVSHHIVSDGQLDISGVITADNLPDLEFLLNSGEASDVTSLQ